MRNTIRIITINLRALLLVLLFPCFLVLPSQAQETPISASSRMLHNGAPLGRALILESVVISGNQRTREAAIQRYLALLPGDEVNAAVLSGARARLIASDFFKTVEVSTRPGTRRGMVVLIVDVEEHGRPVFETGFGYHDTNGWFLTLLGLRFDNTLGSDSQLRIGARLGFRMGGLDAEWLKTLTDDGRYGIGVKFYIYALQHRFFGSGPDATDGSGNPTPWEGDAWSGYNQEIGRVGLETSFKYNVDHRTRFETGLRFEAVRPDSSFTAVGSNQDESQELPPELALESEDARISTLFGRAFRDTRNHPMYPTTGSFARLTVGLSSLVQESANTIFYKATADARKHFHIKDGWVASTHVSGGVTSPDAPYYEHFYLGGNYSVRGFQEWSLSATSGDDGFWMVNQELRVPLTGRDRRVPRLVGLLFFDAGQGWKRDQGSEQIDASVGYGARLNMPWLGTLGLDVGVPLTVSPTNDPYRVHFLLGFSF